MSGAGPLTCRLDFFGADEAITNYRPDSSSWAATMIYGGSDAKAVHQKRETTLKNLRRMYQIDMVRDTLPPI